MADDKRLTTGIFVDPVLGDERVVDERSQSAGTSIVQKVSRVAVASAGALLIGELLSVGQVIALARLLTPAEVGFFAAGTVVTAFAFDFVEGGLRAALVQRQGPIDDAAETVFRVTLFAGVLCTLLALAAAPIIGMIFGAHTAGLVAAAMSCSLLLNALVNVPEALLQREFSIARRIVVGPAVAVTFASVAIALAACGLGVWSMVIGSYASTLVWVIAVWSLAGWRPGRGHFSIKLWRELARFGFPLLYALLGIRLMAIFQSVLIGRVLGVAHLGQFRYAERVAKMPERGIIEIGAIALFPAFSRIAHDADRLRTAFLRALSWAVVPAAALTGLLIALGEQAVTIVLGSPWREAGVAVVGMAGLGLGRAIASVSEEAIKGAGQTRLLNWIVSIQLAVGAALLLALIKPLGIFGVGLAISLTSLVGGIVELTFAKRVIVVGRKPILAALVPPLPAAAIATIATIFFDRYVSDAVHHSTLLSIACLVLDVLLFVFVYLAVLGMVAPSLTQQLLRLVSRQFRRATAMLAHRGAARTHASSGGGSHGE